MYSSVEELGHESGWKAQCITINGWIPPLQADAQAGLASQSKQPLQGTSVAACKWGRKAQQN